MKLINMDILVGKNGLFSKRGCPGNCQHCGLWTEDGCRVILEAPTVDAVEVVHGDWVDKKHYDIYDGHEYVVAHCSNCNSPSRKKSNYCPNCGAKMDGDKHE